MNGIWPWSRFNALEARIKALEDDMLLAVPERPKGSYGPGFTYYPLRNVVSQLMYDAGYHLQRGTATQLKKEEPK